MEFGVQLILSSIFFHHTCSKFGYSVFPANTLRFPILWLVFIKFPQLIIHYLPLPLSLLHQAQIIYLHEGNFPSRTNKYAVFTTSMTNCHIFANKVFFLMWLLFFHIHVFVSSLFIIHLFTLQTPVPYFVLLYLALKMKQGIICFLLFQNSS